jgi:predicted dehydrogenase
MTIKIAFAGTGYINKIHAIAAKNAGAELAAVVNHKPESMAKFAAEFGIPRQYKSVEALLKDSGVDALVVSTPNYLHAEQTVAALEAGVHVMVEKPMAMNGAECAQMVAASRKSGAALMVAHCWRFDEEVLWLKENAARIGRIIRTKSYGVHVHWGPGGWFTQKQLAGGGAMADMGVHALDTARFLLGDPQPVSVYAKIGTYYGSYDVDDTAVFMVEWDNGATSYLESGWWQPHSDGPEASVQLYGANGFGTIYPTRVEVTNRAEQKIDLLDPGFSFPRKNHAPQVMYDRQMAYFFACLREKKTPIPGGAEGLVNMKIVDAAYKSAQTGRVVEIK